MAKYTYESNFDLTREAIKAAPRQVMAKIGKMIATDVRNRLPKQTGRIKRSIGYWARKKEGDLQVGFYNNFNDKKKWAAWYREAVEADNNPLFDAVQQRRSQIVQLIGEALAQIGIQSESYVKRMVNEDTEEQG
jgi:hypothetical protein